MVEVSEDVVARLGASVAAVLPLIALRVPAGPAAGLGRLGAPDDPALRTAVRRRAAMADVAGARARGVLARPGPPRPVPRGVGVPRPMPAGPVAWAGSPTADGSALLAALGDVEPLLAERLLGALELLVDDLRLAGVPDLTACVEPAPAGQYVVTESAGQSEAVAAARTVDLLHPGVAELIESLCRRLAAHDQLREPLAVGEGDEASVAAGHGAAHLALAVATASAVLGQVPVPAFVDRPAAVVGLAVGAAVVLLREAPMPAAYESALLAKARADYLLPRHSVGSVTVSGHRFALAESGFPERADFGGNGLVSVVDGGVVIRTGVEHGPVTVIARVLAEPPASVEAAGWDEVVEVGWRASHGRASVRGPDGGGDPTLARITPPWPGDYRLRVHARGRDDVDDPWAESYELVVWQAPAAPEVVHRRTDRLGHRLRGEPEPDRAPRPEMAYRWLRRSTLSEAATVTVVTGAPVGQVLEAFGADPARPEPMRDIAADLAARGSIDPWVAVLDTGAAVVAVEYNGFQGSSEPVLRQASARGRAASLYWSVDADRRLSFAEDGQMLAAFEPPAAGDLPSTVAAALTGLDLHDVRDRNAKGLVAVERFTGRGLTADDMARIEAAGIGFRIVPHMPPLYPYDPRRVDARLGLDLAALDALPEARLRDAAWWAVAEAASHTDLAGDPDIAESVATRTLTGAALQRARRAQLEAGQERWLWLAAHRATNPDARAAVTDALDAARYAAGPHASVLLDRARAKIA
ncbi:DUF6461 domain-containing protein [Phytohabitans kaempferiae]|uniref:DUF6461 domain-containing protein n=1 Tax=Phytohabitans kaempferiae TaxID=1620943 RepID=A0ABV6MB45_9ACTN